MKFPCGIWATAWLSAPTLEHAAQSVTKVGEALARSRDSQVVYKVNHLSADSSAPRTCLIPGESFYEYMSNLAKEADLFSVQINIRNEKELEVWEASISLKTLSQLRLKMVQVYPPSRSHEIAYKMQAVKVLLNENFDCVSLINILKTKVELAFDIGTTLNLYLTYKLSSLLDNSLSLKNAIKENKINLSQVIDQLKGELCLALADGEVERSGKLTAKDTGDYLTDNSRNYLTIDMDESGAIAKHFLKLVDDKIERYFERNTLEALFESTTVNFSDWRKTPFGYWNRTKNNQ